MSYAQNALIVGLIGLVIYLFRLSAALQEDPEAPEWWQINKTIKALQERQSKSSDPQEKKALQRLLNGLYLLLIYSLVALFFLFSEK